MEMASHLWHLLGLGIIAVVVEFHPPVTFAELGSRKALSEHCHRVVSAGVAAALSGRLGAPPPRPAKEGGTASAPATALGV
jgi:1-acyl-sn-glycerol-3-phosphate acyltransferase